MDTQTTLRFADFDALCIDGDLQGRLFPQPDHRFVQYLGETHIPYRPVQTDRGEWVWEYAEEFELR